MKIENEREGGKSPNSVVEEVERSDDRQQRGESEQTTRIRIRKNT